MEKPTEENCEDLVREATYSVNLTDETLSRVYECIKKPWVAVILIENPEKSSEEVDSICTGSIITERYILTSASCICNENVPGADCVWSDAKESGELYENGQPKYFPASRSSRVDYNFHQFLQIVIPGLMRDFRLSNIRLAELSEEIVTFRTVEATIHPEFVRLKRPEADLCIIKLESKIPIVPGHAAPICLPGPETEDIGVYASMSGWGTFLKKKEGKKKQECTTSGEGPARFQKCRDAFILQGDYMEQCVNLAPPSDLNEQCRQLHTSIPETQSMYTQVLVSKMESVSCYPSNFTQYGWCATCIDGALFGQPGNCDDLENDYEEEYSSVGHDIAWGVCERHCFDNGDETFNDNFLNEVEVSVLTKQACLTKTATEPDPVFQAAVDRELCVQTRKRRSTTVYRVSGKEFKKSGNRVQHVDGGPSTCQGDPGGSVYHVDEEGRPYLLGVGSRVKNCSKETALALYVRVKHYLDWITSIIKK